MVALERWKTPDEIEEVRQMIQRHGQYTRSQRACQVLANWEQMVPKFVKVMPKDYKRVLQAIKTRRAGRLERRRGDHGRLRETSANVARRRRLVDNEESQLMQQCLSRHPTITF